MTVGIHGITVGGLDDLVAGITPTYVDWTADPTDGADITDGDITSFCTTGNHVIGGGWSYAYFEWDLGAMYNVLCTGVLATGATAGTAHCYLTLWDGSAWISSINDFLYGSVLRHATPYGGMCSKVRIGMTSEAASTVTPNIREFHVLRV